MLIAGVCVHMASFHDSMKFRQEGGVLDTNLSIVIPAYNEALRIGRTLERIVNI